MSEKSIKSCEPSRESSRELWSSRVGEVSSSPRLRAQTSTQTVLLIDSS